MVSRSGTKELQAAGCSRPGRCEGAADIFVCLDLQHTVYGARVGSPGRYVSQKPMLILEIQGKEGRFEARSVKAAATLPGWAALPQRFIASTWWRWLNSNISMLLNTAQFCIRRDISLEKKNYGPEENLHQLATKSS